MMALCMNSVAVATEVPEAKNKSEETVAMAEARNIDYYTYPNQLLDGYKTVTVYPGSREALKMHVYMSSGALTVWVKPSSSNFWTKKATWNTTGHHYCDLVSSTNGSAYQVRVFGAAAWFEGGVYSGN